MVLLVFRELVEWMVLFQASKASFGSPYLLGFPRTFYQRGSAQSGAIMCLFAW